MGRETIEGVNTRESPNKSEGQEHQYYATAEFNEMVDDKISQIVDLSTVKPGEEFKSMKMGLRHWK